MMKETHYSGEFQVFAKPVGPACNLFCDYCYYIGKRKMLHSDQGFRMPDHILETYIQQHIKATTGQMITFSWHGGEPLLAGIDFYEKVLSLQKNYCPSGRQIINGIQTNGTLIDEAWCRFLTAAHFMIGLSLDGPEELHNRFRKTTTGGGSFKSVMRAYDLLVLHGADPEILCVVNAENVRYPLEVYRFFRQLGAPFITFIPLVEPQQGKSPVSDRSVPATDFGAFLCAVFDAWVENDIGKMKVQIFEEALRSAFNQEHTLCIFKPVCGSVPVVEHNGDFYSCDHYVNQENLVGNILNIPLESLLSGEKQWVFGRTKLSSLPQYCMECEVQSMCNGECPKNRLLSTPSGEPGLNYLCAGYKKFFDHCKPFADAVATTYKSRDLTSFNPASP
jgi:uncharacterized protein